MSQRISVKASICIIISLACIFIPNTYATNEVKLGSLITGTILGHPQIISIELSNTCIRLVQQNASTSDCPSYYTLKQWDTTNQMLSGKFVNASGYYHRLMPHTANHYQMYPTEYNLIVVDPDPLVMYYAKNIQIVPPGLLYKENKDGVKNDTRIVYQDRYVDSSCKNAVISFSPDLLNDTISYLKNGCTKSNFNATKTVYMPPHKISYDTPLLHYQNWLKDAKHETQNCIFHKCKALKNPTSKW